MSGRLAVDRTWDRAIRAISRRKPTRRCGRRRALRLWALSRSRAGAARPEPPRRPTIARKAPAPPRRCAMRPRAPCGAVVSGGDPGVFAMAAAVCERSRPGRRLARARCRHRSGHHRDAGGRGADRRAARPRFLRAVAVRQSQALGPDRAPARCRGGRGLRDRALQSGLAGAAVATRPRAFERLRRHLPAATPVVFGRAVGRPDEQHQWSPTLGAAESGAGRHGDAGDRRLARKPASSGAAGTFAARLHAARGRRGRAHDRATRMRRFDGLDAAPPAAARAGAA